METKLNPANSNQLPPGKFSARVLYIEDDVTNQRLMAQIFQHRRHLELLAALDPDTGLRIAHDQALDLILLDINLPGMDGFEVMTQLRQNPVLSAIPVIAISANAMPETITRGMEAGFSAYLTKPMNIPDLLAILDRILPHVEGLPLTE